LIAPSVQSALPSCSEQHGGLDPAAFGELSGLLRYVVKCPCFNIACSAGKIFL